MKRLLKSSKFWLAMIGSVFAVSTFKITNEINLSYWVLGAFIGGVIGTTAEDIMSKSIPGGGIPPPPPPPPKKEE